MYAENKLLVRNPWVQPLTLVGFYRNQNLDKTRRTFFRKVLIFHLQGVLENFIGLNATRIISCFFLQLSNSKNDYFEIIFLVLLSIKYHFIYLFLLRENISLSFRLLVLFERVDTCCLNTQYVSSRVKCLLTSMFIFDLKTLENGISRYYSRNH